MQHSLSLLYSQVFRNNIVATRKSRYLLQKVGTYLHEQVHKVIQIATLSNHEIGSHEIAILFSNNVFIIAEVTQSA